MDITERKSWTKVEAGCYTCGPYKVLKQTSFSVALGWTLVAWGKAVEHGHSFEWCRRRACRLNLIERAKSPETPRDFLVRLLIEEKGDYAVRFYHRDFDVVAHELARYTGPGILANVVGNAADYLCGVELLSTPLIDQLRDDIQVGDLAALPALIDAASEAGLVAVEANARVVWDYIQGVAK